MVIIPNEYGRAGRIWSGRIASSKFVRFCEEVSSVEDDVTVELRFGQDGHGRTTVNGLASVSCSLPCHRCAADMKHRINAEIDARIVHTETQASEIGDNIDVIVCDQGAVEINTLVEDDLILSIPWQVCPSNEACQIDGAREYLAEGSKSAERRQPFASLRDMLRE